MGLRLRFFEPGDFESGDLLPVLFFCNQRSPSHLRPALQNGGQLDASRVLFFRCLCPTHLVEYLRHGQEQKPKLLH